MAWEDVPLKMSQYDAEDYSPDDASNDLLLFFDVTQLSDVGVERRDEFEERLDYRLEACTNLRNSRAVHPSKLQG